MGSYNTIIIVSIVNIVILTTIGIVLFKAIKGIKSFINRNKELHKKVDIILSKLEEEDKM